MATTVIRFKYYHAWLLSDAICNNSGLGFNGYESDGNPKWNLITNINVISFEVRSTRCENFLIDRKIKYFFSTIFLDLVGDKSSRCHQQLEHGHKSVVAFGCL